MKNFRLRILHKPLWPWWLSTVFPLYTPEANFLRALFTSSNPKTHRWTLPGVSRWKGTKSFPVHLRLHGRRWSNTSVPFLRPSCYICCRLHWRVSVWLWHSASYCKLSLGKTTKRHRASFTLYLLIIDIQSRLIKQWVSRMKQIISFALRNDARCIWNP